MQRGFVVDEKVKDVVEHFRGKVVEDHGRRISGHGGR